MAYNFEKNTCDTCGITKEEAKKHPVDTGIAHEVYELGQDEDGLWMCSYNDSAPTMTSGKSKA